ncbi:KTSC domain-containing protein [Flavihumibacter petaseus]|uniref:KTSC domain-containing protein n=1 Tax=Flavihumibacter petaseus NBRC 106054 TaxID=1220578 RepID=A0A0E9N396_9BACT|nr:KTSC domain-containing protein [Flavihumibacter petaseus]GAO43830.1 hypothetical protein FPE01S_02_09360 [Flavihumibacter petaseus NBRC 106054]
MPSTVIAHIDYSPADHTLTIRFVSGMVYQYLDVPEPVYQAFLQFREKGVYLNKFIKGKYRFKKL